MRGSLLSATGHPSSNQYRFGLGREAHAKGADVPSVSYSGSVGVMHVDTDELVVLFYQSQEEEASSYGDHWSEHHWGCVKHCLIAYLACVIVQNYYLLISSNVTIVAHDVLV